MRRRCRHSRQEGEGRQASVPAAIGTKIGVPCDLLLTSSCQLYLNRCDPQTTFEGRNLSSSMKRNFFGSAEGSGSVHWYTCEHQNRVGLRNRRSRRLQRCVLLDTITSASLFLNVGSRTAI